MQAVDQLRALASEQDGQFATTQARELGLARNAVGALRDRGEIYQVRRSVWRFRAMTGVPDPAVTAFLACWPHGVISGRSAGLWHGLQRVGLPTPAEVTVERSHSRRPPGIVVRTTRQLPGCDVVKVGPLRYTSLARTICDLADAAKPVESLALLDDAVALGARPAWIHQRASALVDGRGGVALIRDATHPQAAGEFRSWLERTAGAVYSTGGLPEPRWNVAVHDADGLVGIVDALWLPWNVVSETEGLRFHTTPAQRRKDAERFNRLADAGYTVRRFTWQDVVGRPAWVVLTLAKALRAAGADIDMSILPQDLPPPPLTTTIGRPS